MAAGQPSYGLRGREAPEGDAPPLASAGPAETAVEECRGDSGNSISLSLGHGKRGENRAPAAAVPVFPAETAVEIGGGTARVGIGGWAEGRERETADIAVGGRRGTSVSSRPPSAVLGREGGGSPRSRAGAAESSSPTSGEVKSRANPIGSLTLSNVGGEEISALASNS